MAWTPYQSMLAVVMVITGSINTLSTKWADFLPAEGRDHAEKRSFNHPFVQACAMFLGEFLCFIVFKILFYYYKSKQDGSLETKDLVKGNQGFNPFIFFPPAMFDMIATSVMYIGLNLTYASSFQMFRGSVIVFVAILSIIILHHKILLRQWLGIVLVIAGLAVVGVSDFLGGKNNSDDDRSNSNVIIGDALIVIAQIVTALQMVYEEKYVAGKDIPALQAVGWEGFFGLVVLGILQIPFYFIYVPPPFASNPRHVLEDFLDAMVQMGNNPLLIVSIIGTVISIAFFNFAGISVTKELSATTRMILDSVRTLFIWLISLGLKWQTFSPIQVPGFILLIIGMCVYNNILPTWDCLRCKRKKDEKPNTINSVTSDPS